MTLHRRATQSSVEPRFKAVHHRWPLVRSSRSFKVGVVEPGRYEPAAHAELFYKVVTGVVTPEQERLESLADRNLAPRAEPFDLITFPEAFVPASALLEVVTRLINAGPTGCFHAGLRPDQERHLFRVEELRELLIGLERVVGVPSDVSSFGNWLDEQPAEHVFNVGAVFAIDADELLRVCLHPKLVRAGVEIDSLPESHMAEADLLTLVTLLPSDPRLLTVTVQPLLCSDVLDLQTDRPDGSPLKAITRFADCFTDRAPDHIDVVSVATCTPQRWSRREDESAFHEWPEQFRRAFESTASGGDMVRHHFSAFVLANFRVLDNEKPGGLSGVFLPVSPGRKSFHRDVVVSAFGRLRSDPARKDSNLGNTWSRPGDDPQNRWECRGFVAGLNPFSVPLDCPVRMFAFHIHRLPREHSFWDATNSLAKCVVQVGHRDHAGDLHLKIRETGHA